MNEKHKYDLFVSYSRKDKEKVYLFMDRLKNRIPGLNYWHDVTGVESADEFEDKIVSAIDNSAYVIFFLSENSIASPYTKDEVTYAKNTDKKVLPVLLPGAKLKGWFLFKFGRVDYIECDNAAHFDKLVRNLVSWTGKKEQPVQPKPEPKKEPGKSFEAKKEEGKIDEDKNLWELLKKVKGKDLLPALFLGGPKISELIIPVLANSLIKTYSPASNGHEAVDLGLPSGLKWASYNVGATKPEEYGGYYAWGETEEKSDYDWDTYKYCHGTYDSMTKYCTDSRYGTVDNKTTLEPADDVATVKWGGAWRMPTIEEQDELRNNCTWTWTTLNGVNGYRVTGPNGKSIFLPAAGYRDGTEVYDRGSHSLYWSSSLGISGCNDAYNLNLNSGNYAWGCSYRIFGSMVRPVCT